MNPTNAQDRLLNVNLSDRERRITAVLDLVETARYAINFLRRVDTHHTSGQVADWLQSAVDAVLSAPDEKDGAK